MAPKILAFRSLRDHGFKASLGCISNSRPLRLCLKQTNEPTVGSYHSYFLEDSQKELKILFLTIFVSLLTLGADCTFALGLDFSAPEQGRMNTEPAKCHPTEEEGVGQACTWDPE